MAAPDEPRTRWQQIAGGASGADYAARFEALAASGKDVHGEATFCAGLLASLVEPVEPVETARVLDAGCGTGRVAVRLAELGFRVVGVDVDESMLEVARAASPDVDWILGDVAALPPEVGSAGPYDLVVLAGNVIPLLAPGTVPDAVRGLASTLAPGGLLVAGFGLDPAHLPPGCPVTPLAEYDGAVLSHGLTLVDRFATWDRAPYDPAAGYAVSVHRRA